MRARETRAEATRRTAAECATHARGLGVPLEQAVQRMIEMRKRIIRSAT